MIEVRYDRAALSVRVSGHARSAVKGRDLVCAAASVLACTLAADAQELCRAAPAYFPACSVRLDPGDAEISLSHTPQAAATAALVFEAVLTGFRLLAAEHPRCVRVKES